MDVFQHANLLYLGKKKSPLFIFAARKHYQQMQWQLCNIKQSLNFFYKPVSCSAIYSAI